MAAAQRPPERVDYANDHLIEADAPADPFALFDAWMAQAVAERDRGWIIEPAAVQVATVTDDGQPSVRTVLLRGVRDGGFVFFTNYESDKGNQLAGQPRAALHVHWPAPFYRQIRVEGTVSKTPRAGSEEYFASRPRGSQVAAWASAQSRPVDGLDALSDAYARVEERYAGRDVPCPPHWGGYLLLATRIEFWQGQPNRLHDRLLYRKVGTHWQRGRIAP